jgi:hypothetical protein
MPRWTVVLSRDIVPRRADRSPPTIEVQAKRIKPNCSGFLKLTDGGDSVVLLVPRDKWYVVGNSEKVNFK